MIHETIFENAHLQITMDGKTVAGLSYYKDQLEWTVPMNYAKGRRLRVTQTSQILTICEFADYGMI